MQISRNNLSEKQYYFNYFFIVRFSRCFDGLAIMHISRNNLSGKQYRLHFFVFVFSEARDDVS